MKDKLMNALYELVVAGEDRTLTPKGTRHSPTNILKRSKLPDVADTLLNGSKFHAGNYFYLSPKRIGSIFRIHIPGLKEHYPLFYEQAKKILIHYGFRKKIERESNQEVKIVAPNGEIQVKKKRIKKAKTDATLNGKFQRLVGEYKYEDDIYKTYDEDD